MKQRLLLSLLMLFVSVGILKAGVDITIAKGDPKQSVTITFTSSAGKFAAPTAESVGSYPVIQGYNDATKYLTVTPGSAVYKIPYSEKETGTTVTLATTDTNKDWGNITITVDGKVTSFVSQDKIVKAVTEQITGIIFTNNGELAALKLGANQRRINCFPKLATLNVAGNKLQYIPVKEDKDEKGNKIAITNYTIGEQTPDVTFKGLASIGNSREGIMLTADALSFANGDNPLQGAENLEIVSLEVVSGDAATAVADENYANTKKYYFMDAAHKIFMDGEYKAKIKVNDKKYEGAIICGVPVSVSPAIFKLLKAEGDAHGKINTGKIEVNVTELEKGHPVTLTPEPEEGYKLEGDFKTVGLTFDRKDGDVSYYKVTGDVNPEVTATFTPDGATLKYTAPANAIIKVKKADGTELNSGSSVTVGDKLTVIVTPAEGYTVSSVKDGDTPLVFKSTDGGTYEAEVIVDADGVNITAEVAIQTYKLTIVYKGGAWTGADIKNATSGKDIAGEILPSGNEIEFGVNYKMPLAIYLTLKNASDVISSVTIESSSYNARLLGNGKYIVEGFTMPAKDVRVVVEISSMSQISIEPIGEINNGYLELTYDGTPKTLEYKITPTNLQGVKVEYAREESPTSYIKDPYTECGNYIAHFYYDADETHQIIKGETVKYKIIPAEVVITDEPTITISEDGNTYEISGGEAAYMRNGQPVDITDAGKFTIDDAHMTVEETDTYVLVHFTPNDTKNLNIADVEIILQGEDVKSYTVKIDPSSVGILTMKHGSALVEDGATVLAGTKIGFEITPEEGLTAANYEVVQLDGEGNIVSKGDLITGVEVGEHGDTNATTLIFRADLKSTVNQRELVLSDNENVEQKVNYTGKVQKFDHKLLNVVAKETGEVPQGGIWTVSYTQNGQTIAEPVNVGTYDVKVTRDATNNFKKFEVSGTLVINQAKLDEAGIHVPLPTASRINVGMPLSYSYLSGSADIPGYYSWNATVDEVMESKGYTVTFYPYNSNYEPLKLNGTVRVPVTDEAIIMVSQSGYGYLTIKDANGKSYGYGDAVPENTQLTFTATPDEDFQFESLVIDGTTYSNNVVSYTFGKKSIFVSVTFGVKKEDPIVIPEGQYAVVFPDAVRGAKISYTGDPIVERDKDFKFAVTTLAADVSKLVVKANGSTLTRAADGSYTIKKVQEKQNVTVSFSSTPTEVKVNIPLIYHEKGQPTSGRVQIINNTSNDGKYYYNDELTLIAYPETGVEFSSWSDKNKDSVRDIVLDKAEVSLQAVFTGTPVTGIEDIESAAIYTGRGFIMVKNVANAKVTVVSISGRLQAQEEVNGDTRIDVPQGIYVVVLESGSDAKRMKVIVK